MVKPRCREIRGAGIRRATGAPSGQRARTFSKRYRLRRRSRSNPCCDDLSATAPDRAALVRKGLLIRDNRLSEWFDLLNGDGFFFDLPDGSTYISAGRHAIDLDPENSNIAFGRVPGSPATAALVVCRDLFCTPVTDPNSGVQRSDPDTGKPLWDCSGDEVRNVIQRAIDVLKRSSRKQSVDAVEFHQFIITSEEHQNAREKLGQLA